MLLRRRRSRPSRRRRRIELSDDEESDQESDQDSVDIEGTLIVESVEFARSRESAPSPEAVAEAPPAYIPDHDDTDSEEEIILADEGPGIMSDSYSDSEDV